MRESNGSVEVPKCIIHIKPVQRRTIWYYQQQESNPFLKIVVVLLTMVASYHGIETVRRDNCLLVKNLVNECLHKILINRDINGAKEYVKDTIVSDLHMNRIDLSLLVITKGSSKSGGDYDVKAAHLELAKRMRKGDPTTAPNIGDRVPYVIIKDAKGAKAYEWSEDPSYVLEHNIPIDVDHYLDNQISKPLLRISEAILQDASRELFRWDTQEDLFLSVLLPTKVA
ncbi:hypothetical protein CDL15_Pgr020792 [Punica granatum]|uniref:DNA-directed DNA polymerase n=1 Tax=Punica granatum TaxID=22663 RepID=A0A218XVL8_PUNGR|nr:hypothetical protein CDL15_Pgr020792 [Punica granatum]